MLFEKFVESVSVYKISRHLTFVVFFLNYLLDISILSFYDSPSYQSKCIFYPPFNTDASLSLYSFAWQWSQFEMK